MMISESLTVGAVVSGKRLDYDDDQYESLTVATVVCSITSIERGAKLEVANPREADKRTHEHETRLDQLCDDDGKPNEQALARKVGVGQLRAIEGNPNERTSKQKPRNA